MVWNKPATGAWAASVEEEEEKLGAIPPPAVKETEFPSLGMAAAVKETKKDKKKKTMSLADFNSAPFGAGRIGRRAVPDDNSILLSLPTAPRQREEGDEPDDRPTGGFRTYGGAGGGRYGDEERRPRRDDMEDDGPSRADTSDSWGAERKFVPGGGGDSYGGRDRGGGGGFGGGGFGGGGGFRDREERGGGGYEDREPRRAGFEDDGPSRADGAADWGATRQFVPSSGSPRRGGGGGGGGGGGFSDRPGGFGEGGYREREPAREPSRADAESRWERPAGEAKPTAFDDRPRRAYEDDAPRRGLGDGYRGRDSQRDSSRDRYGDRSGSRTSRGSSPDQWRRREAPGAAPGAGGDGPRERPKLNLKPRTAAEAAPAEGAGAPTAAAPAPAPRPSLFGAARPREDVLKEQGRDAVREDQQLEVASRPPPTRAPRRKDTAPELALKARIAAARAAQGKPAAAAGEAADKPAEGEPAAEPAAEAEAEAPAEGDAEPAPEAAAADPAAPAPADDDVAALEAELKALRLELDDKAKAAREAREPARGRENGAPRDRERAPRRDGSKDPADRAPRDKW